MQRPDVFAVQVQGDVALESDDRQRRLRRRLFVELDRSAVSARPPPFETLPHVVLGNHRRSGVGEGLVAPRMISVIVRIDHESHRLVGDFQLLQRRLDLVRQGRELIVDEHHSIFPHRRGDVPARSLQHVDVAGDLRRLDLDLRKVVLLSVQRP